MTWTNPSDAQHYGSRMLEGESVRLRPLEEADLTDLVRWWREPEWAVLQQGTVRPRRVADVEDQFRSWSRNENAGSVGFSVVDKTSAQLVGHVTLYGGQLPARTAILAIIIGSEHVGRRYGTDAVRLLTDYGFRELGLNRIELQVWAFNTRARSVYSTIGFVEEGIRREAVFHDGAFHNEVIMAVLAREWSSRS